MARYRTRVIQDSLRHIISVRVPRLPSRWYSVSLLIYSLIPETNLFYHRENPAVVMSGLFLVFLWYQCNKRRRARSIPLTRMSPTRATSLPKLETEAEKGEAGFTAGVLPFRSPTASMPSHVSESHLPQGYQPVYVESAVPWVKAGNYSISDPNPGPLSPSYALSWAAPPPRDSPTVLPVQKETHLPGSHRDETWTGGNVMR